MPLRLRRENFAFFSSGSAGLWIVAAALATSIVGCGESGPKYVPVSGIVTVDGKPYDKAVVAFLPKSTATNPNPGHSSAGETDANGRFVLKTHDLKSGAVIGKHLVKVQTRTDTPQFDPTTGSQDTPQPKTKADPIPAAWNALSEHEFDVPPTGTDKANFDIVTKKEITQGQLGVATGGCVFVYSQNTAESIRVARPSGTP